MLPRPIASANAAAVDHVSFTVNEGTICMLLGTSGSGKTTLLRMVNRLIDPTSGEVQIDGIPTTAQNPITLRRQMGYVIQQVGLVSSSLHRGQRENRAFDPGQARRRDQWAR